MDEELVVDDILAQLSPTGRLEWELAVVKTQLLRERAMNAQLTKTRSDPDED